MPLLVGACLRIWNLTRQSLWIDEILTLQAASLGEPFRWGDVLINPQGPLPHVLLRGWTLVFGAGDLALRSWAVTGGILAMLAFAIALRKLWPKALEVGLWFVALSPFQIWYAQEVRNYVFVLLVAPLVLWAFLVALEKGRGRWLVFGLLLGALLLCNLSTLFLIPALGVWVLWQRPRSTVAFTLASLLALALAAPWIYRELFGHVAWGAVTENPADDAPIRGGREFPLLAIPYSILVFIGGFGIGPPLRWLHAGLSPEWSKLWLGLALVGLSLSGSFLVLLRKFREPRILLIWCWCFVPLVCAAVVAALGWKAFNPRYIAFTQPLWLCAVAVASVVLLERWRKIGFLLILATALAMGLGWSRQALNAEYAREDFRAVAEYLESRAETNDLILEQGVSGPLARYFDGQQKIETFFPVYLSPPDDAEAKLTEILGDHPRVWWVGSRLWYEDTERLVLKLLAGRGQFESSWTAAGVEVRLYRMDRDAP